MKYAVIFANKADDDYDLSHIPPEDYCFVVEADDADDAFIKWKMPKDYNDDWMLTALIPIDEVRAYAASIDGIPFYIRLQCCRKQDLTPDECYMLGIKYEAVDSNK